MSGVVVESLIARHSSCCAQDALGNYCVGGQREERTAAGIDEVPDVAVVPALGVVSVVIRMRGLRLECRQQREVQLLAVGGGVIAGLLGERVDVVVGRLEGHSGAHDCGALRAGREHGEGGRPFKVAALGLLGQQRQSAQCRIGNLLGAAPPMVQLTGDLGEDAEPVSAGRSCKRLREL